MQYSISSLASARSWGIIPSLHLLAVPLLIQPTTVRFKGCEVVTGYSDWECGVVLALWYSVRAGNTLLGLGDTASEESGDALRRQPPTSTCSRRCVWGVTSKPCSLPRHGTRYGKARGKSPPMVTKGVLPRERPASCTLGVPTPAISPNAGNLTSSSVTMSSSAHAFPFEKGERAHPATPAW